jgi:hypothetical protein
VHCAYFAHLDDSEQMRHHRIRQASNFLGPSGFVWLDDAAVFECIHIASGGPGFVTFQRGYRRLEPQAAPVVQRIPTTTTRRHP